MAKIRFIRRSIAYILSALALAIVLYLAVLSRHSTPGPNNPLPPSSSMEKSCKASALKSRSQLLMQPVAGVTMDAHLALAFLFPDYDREQGIAVWRPGENHDIYRYLYGHPRHSDLQTKSAFTARYRQAEGDHFIIVFQTERYFIDCHACTVVLGAAVFVKKEGEWHLKAVTRAIEAAGSYGRATERMALVKVGPGLHAVEVRDGYMQHGIYIEYYSLLSPVGDRVEAVFHLPEAGGSNAGACSGSEDGPFPVPGCYDFDVSLAFLEGNYPPYRDIEVTKEGTRYAGSHRVTGFKEVSVYRFDGCRYSKGPGVDIGPAKPHFIQIAAFERYRSASDLVQALQASGYPAYCQFYKPEPGNSVFRVRIGNYASALEAGEVLHLLGKNGHDGFLSQ